MIAHLIGKIHHYETQGVNEAELMFNDPLNRHPLHEKVYSSAPNQQNTIIIITIIIKHNYYCLLIKTQNT